MEFFSVLFLYRANLYYPEFVEWCVSNFSPTERVIMNKNATIILCQVNAKFIRLVLNVPEIFIVNTEALSEESMVQVYREFKSEIKNSFLS